MDETFMHITVCTCNTTPFYQKHLKYRRLKALKEFTVYSGLMKLNVEHKLSDQFTIEISKVVNYEPFHFIIIIIILFY